ncbi:SRPBCC family protein [Actinomycetospora lemnae]|uniref:SRPBCC family protein n=1 Tax=Actinomycetospora lemnae TaxID=3019891 RepID=A0ABT5SPZ6_9PSEU|nr:SRPBCC family protein [Actinomycetospora sp. DW7H6]MDD7964919.1 SRPBCC family protein [Actinomycetospora sp. DW7H6]
MTRTGTYLEIDGRPALRFVREYDHAPERVFALLTDPAELVHWFPAGVAPESWEPGATVTYTFETPGDGGTGTVLVHEPPRRVAFSWGGDELWFEVEALDGGRSRLAFTHLIDEKPAAARNAAGWELCLDALDAAVAGTPVAPSGGRTPAWEAIYQEFVAAGMPSGAPIPG